MSSSEQRGVGALWEQVGPWLRALRVYVLGLALFVAIVLLVRFVTWGGANHIHLVPLVEFNDQSALSATLNPRVCLRLPWVPGEGDPSNLRYCPPNHGIYGTKEGTIEGHGSGSRVPVQAACCPLPASDILTEEHVYGVLGSCPENYIVTSGIESCANHCMVRCTKINTQKYRLGPKREAFYWKVAGSFPSSGRGDAKQIRFHHIPKGIRRGVAFLGKGYALNDPTSEDGCTGIPFGSLLVGKKHENCDGFVHRQLFFRETDKAVRMYPGCADVKDDGTCVARNTDTED